MDITKLSEPLPIDQIDFRIQSVNKVGYATILAYKNARVDMQRLDDVFGVLGWKREHSRDNRNCTILVWDNDRKHWVGKEDTGTESNAEAEKGLASDSFKRSGFNFGIGRDLYDYPDIIVKLNDNEWEIYPYFDKRKNKEIQKARTTWNLKLKEWLWYSEFTDKKITFLAARDFDKVRFTWGKRKQESKK